MVSATDSPASGEILGLSRQGIANASAAADSVMYSDHGARYAPISAAQHEVASHVKSSSPHSTALSRAADTSLQLRT
jgi:hypothetical protein